MTEQEKAKLTRADQKLWGVMAQYDTPGALKKAAEVVRDAGFQKWDAYSPFPVHGLDPKMGIKMTILPILVFGAGITGTFLAFLLQWWTNAWDWPWIVSGKPFFSIPANVPIAFEVTVLLAAFTAFFGMWGLNKLPQVWHPLFSKDRFRRVTDDGFFIAIESADPSFVHHEVRALLDKTGAMEVEDCHVSTDPRQRRVPRGVMAFIVMSTALAVVPFAFIAKARTDKSRQPHYHVIPSMDFQPYQGPQDESAVFDNQTTMRRWPEGTVARGYLPSEDEGFYRGIEGGQWVTSFPTRPGKFDLDMNTIERGRERFNIYCTPCHGYSGFGNGMVHQRAEQLGATKWVQPTSLHMEHVVKQPHGQLFNTITHGIRNMQGYGAQIPPGDRWAIVLYLRALQRSQATRASELPPEMQRNLR